MRLPAVCIFFAVLLVLVPVPAAPGAEGAEKAVRAVPGPSVALVDCRTLTLAHETLVPLDEDFAVGGALLRFSPGKDGALAVEVRAAGTEPAGRGKALRDVPGLVEFEAFGGRYGVSARWAGDRKGVHVGSAFGLEIRVGRGRGFLVDSDRDGVLGSAGDGYVAPESRTPGPWCGQAWSADAAVSLRRAEDGGWWESPVPMPRPEDRDHSEAWRLLQWRRQQCGVLPLGYDPAFEEGIRKHAAYCEANSFYGHDEIEGRPGYSKEGAEAGAQSVLGFGRKSLVDAMEQQLLTLYHRSGLLSPALERTGMALHLGNFGANVIAARSGPLADRLLVFPPHGMENVPRRFSEAGETPMPVAGEFGSLQQLGTCVGIYAKAFATGGALAERPLLTVAQLGGKDGEAVRTYKRNVGYPGSPPHPGVSESNSGNVAITPSEILAAKTTYRCAIRVALPADVRTPSGGATLDFVWEFTTGR